MLAGLGFTAWWWILLPTPYFLGAVLGMELVVLLKETLLDPRIETDQPFFWAGAEDLAFWQPGIGLTLLGLFLLHKPL